MTIKLKSALSFGLIFFLLLILGIFQQKNANSQIQKIQLIEDKTLQSTLLADELKLAVVQVQQYLTDISATRALDNLNDGFNHAESYSQIFYENIQKLKELNPQDSERLKNIQVSFNEYYSNGQEMAKNYIKGGPELGNQIMLEFDTHSVEINEKVDKFQQENILEVTNSLKDIEQLVEANNTFFKWTFAIILIVSISVALLLIRSIVVPLRKIMVSTKEIAGGNLKNSVIISSKDEFGQLSQSFENMRVQLSMLITKIDETSKEIVSSSSLLTTNAEFSEKAFKNITASMEIVALGTERQASDMLNSNQYISEVSLGMNQAASAVQVVTNLGTQAKEDAGKGNRVVQETLEQMELIHTKVDGTFEVINRLEQKSKEINQIISIITEIASQTNLLALNAAIESARAGEHGKGFAVVADEVKKLAGTSAESANKIRTVIGEILNEVENAICSMNEGILAVNKGSKKASQTGKAFEDIGKIIEEISAQNHEVSAVVEQVNASADGIVGIVQRITEISEELANNAQNVSQVVENQHQSTQKLSTSVGKLNFMAIDLKESVSQFKL